MNVYVLERMQFSNGWAGVFSSPKTAAETVGKDEPAETVKWQLVRLELDDSLYGNRSIVRNWKPKCVDWFDKESGK